MISDISCVWEGHFRGTGMQKTLTLSMFQEVQIRIHDKSFRVDLTKNVYLFKFGLDFTFYYRFIFLPIHLQHFFLWHQ